MEQWSPKAKWRKHQFVIKYSKIFITSLFFIKRIYSPHKQPKDKELYDYF